MTPLSPYPCFNSRLGFGCYRKLPCGQLDKFSPQLIANSLAFMNCVTGSEEQRELEAIERLAAKASLLDQPRQLPPGSLLPM